MPLERPVWRATEVWGLVNQQLTRLMDVLGLSDRYSVLVANTTRTVELTTPLTLIESTTTAGAVTLTLPTPAQHPGYRVDVLRVAGANALTVNGVSVTTFAGFVCTGTTWRRVA